jgi:aldose 1-epimerase
LQLDDLLTDIDTRCDVATGLRYFGRVVAADGQPALEVHASPVFRELVVFTPPHRQAVCLEPYTCPTDAIHLQQKGIEAGWLTLAPGAEWSAIVELRVTAG